jgi:TPR repeat protein
MNLNSLAFPETESVLNLPNGGNVIIRHYDHSTSKPLSNLGVDGLIIEGLWGFNDLGGYLGSEISALLGVSESTICKMCYEQIQKSQQITVVALRSSNSASKLKSVAFVPTEAFDCCEIFRDTKYGLPCKDFYYNITYEALDLLMVHGCSSVAIANLTGYTYYHKNIGNCVAEAIAHFAIKNPKLQSVFSICRGPDLTYGVTFFNNHQDLVGQHRPIQRNVHVGEMSSFTSITLPRQVFDPSTQQVNDSDIVQNLIKNSKDGDANAQCLLGDEFSAVGDNWEAVKWYRKAAEQGNPDAQFQLGQWYDDPDQMEDFAEALKWYHKAAENGQAAAQYSLGLIYVAGKQVPENLAEAFKWFHKAANQGRNDAQYKVGKMYEEGVGVKKNVVQALKWFTLSASSHDLSAIADRDSVIGYMTPAQITEAHKLVQKWNKIPTG